MFFEKECQILNLPLFSPKDVVRKKYLELVRQYPPEKYPEKTAEIRDAYEKLYNIKDYLDLFMEFPSEDEEDNFKNIILELEKEIEPLRIPVETLLSLR